MLESNLGVDVDFFAFPYDVFDDASVQHLIDEGYVAARAGERGLNAGDFPDAFAVGFDTYGPDQSVYSGDILTAYVDAAIAEGGWAVREFHGVEDSSWESVPLPEYTAHLDYVVDRIDAGELWLAPPTEVVHYRFAREACAPTAVGNTVQLDAPAPGCLDHPSLLTLRLSIPDATGEVTAEQDGQPRPVVDLGANEYLVDLANTGGPLTLAY